MSCIETMAVSPAAARPAPEGVLMVSPDRELELYICTVDTWYVGSGLDSNLGL